MLRQWVAVLARVLAALAIILPAAVELALTKTPFRPKSPAWASAPSREEPSRWQPDVVQDQRRRLGPVHAEPGRRAGLGGGEGLRAVFRRQWGMSAGNVFEGSNSPTL